MKTKHYTIDSRKLAQAIAARMLIGIGREAVSGRSNGNIKARCFRALQGNERALQVSKASISPCVTKYNLTELFLKGDK